MKSRASHVEKAMVDDGLTHLKIQNASKIPRVRWPLCASVERKLARIHDHGKGWNRFCTFDIRFYVARLSWIMTPFRWGVASLPGSLENFGWRHC